MKYSKFGVTCKERIWTEKMSRWVGMDIGEASWVDQNVWCRFGHMERVVEQHMVKMGMRSTVSEVALQNYRCRVRLARQFIYNPGGK